MHHKYDGSGQEAMVSASVVSLWWLDCISPTSAAPDFASLGYGTSLSLLVFLYPHPKVLELQ